ncbi:hypothetical protein L2E82_30510 [Cichorium intybus]|uniref:Uncharacterized protein n=1 Tax=Cichorium intybus TaxID=13427 RepID=A0ACB9D0G7_CICIN|nr:hypothetical protein L2E82_30510 [Cichorium intybus]
MSIGDEDRHDQATMAAAKSLDAGISFHANGDTTREQIIMGIGDEESQDQATMAPGISLAAGISFHANEDTTRVQNTMCIGDEESHDQPTMEAGNSFRVNGVDNPMDPELHTPTVLLGKVVKENNGSFSSWKGSQLASFKTTVHLKDKGVRH